MFAGSFLTCAIAAGPAMDQIENWKRDAAINNAIIGALAQGDKEKIDAYTVVHVRAWQNVTGKTFEGWMPDLLAKMGDNSIVRLTMEISKEAYRMVTEDKPVSPPVQPQRYDV